MSMSGSVRRMRWKALRFLACDFQTILGDFTTHLQIFVCCEALAEGLKHNSTLTDMNLGLNNIGPVGAQAWCLVRMVRLLRNQS